MFLARAKKEVKRTKHQICLWKTTRKGVQDNGKDKIHISIGFAPVDCQQLFMNSSKLFCVKYFWASFRYSFRPDSTPPLVT